MNAVTFIGHHNAGKTALIRRLIPALRARGLRVGTAKHVAPDVELDSPGKDSYIHRRAGAERVLVLSDSGGALLWEHAELAVEQHVQRYLGDLDLVLLEGFKHSSLPKIEVYQKGEPLAGHIPVLAVVAERRPRVPDDVPLLPPDEEEIADFLEAHLLGT
ncbi:MAG: molybdopterin-guanine dinucleotide biosynthesis protein B [Candidatus Bipolaricaulota bacterium]